jgi:hypothetical protein
MYVGSFGELSSVLCDIKKFGVVKHLPRRFILGSVMVHHDDVQSSDEPRRLNDVVALLERDGHLLVLSLSDSRREYRLTFRPDERSIAVFHTMSRFKLEGTSNQREGTLFVYR